MAIADILHDIGSGLAQSVTATCTTLGSSSLASLVYALRAKASTAITYGVTIANTPTYDLEVRLEQP